MLCSWRNNPQYLEWHPLYILLLGFGAEGPESATIRQKIADMARLNQTLNLSAWAAALRIPVKATGESGRRRPPIPVEGDQFGAEPLDVRLKFIGKVAYRFCSIKSAA